MRIDSTTLIAIFLIALVAIIIAAIGIGITYYLSQKMKINPTDLITIILVIVTAAGIGITYYFSFRKHRIDGLMIAFKILNSVKHRKARKMVYFCYKEFTKNENIKVFNQPEVKKVMGDFNVIGNLIKSGNIDYKLFMREYGSTAYSCWDSVSVYVNKEREKRNFEPFMENFEWLAEEATKYWQRQGYDLSQIRVYDEES